jgi:hypothetical protein
VRCSGQMTGIPHTHALASSSQLFMHPTSPRTSAACDEHELLCLHRNRLCLCMHCLARVHTQRRGGWGLGWHP